MQKVIRMKTSGSTTWFFVILLSSMVSVGQIKGYISGKITFAAAESNTAYTVTTHPAFQANKTDYVPPGPLNPIDPQGFTTYAQGRLIVKLKSAATVQNSNTLQSELHATVLKKFPLTGIELWQIHDMDVESAIARYTKDPRIEYIEPDYRIQLIPTTQNELPHIETLDSVSNSANLNSTPNDPDFVHQWALNNTGQGNGTVDADIDALEAWRITTGSEVLIGVIDSGIDYTHPDLATNMWINPGEIPDNQHDDDQNGYVDDVYGWDFAADDNDPMDENEHGTHVAGVIAAAGNNGIGITGVSWSARIMALKFLDENGAGWTSDAVEALQYATMMGAKITNNSWGGTGYSYSLYDAIQAARERGQLFIASSGNDYGVDIDTSPVYPSGYDLDNIIVVAATDRDDLLGVYSNYGAISVDLAAPGSSIYSTLPENRYKSYSGTSMAAPHVTGAASLLWSVHPNASVDEVKGWILDTTDFVSDLEGKVATNGRLNIHNALEAAQPPVTPTLAISQSISVPYYRTGDDSSFLVPIQFIGQGAEISSLNFSIDIQESCLAVDPTDSNADGIPDAITFNLPEKFVASVTLDNGDTDGELDFLIADSNPPYSTLSDGVVGLVRMMPICEPAPNNHRIATIDFVPEPTFLAQNGENIPGRTQDGSVEITFVALPGDCNSDNLIDAGDGVASVLEIFDGDGDSWADVPGGDFVGAPTGCDANQDSVVDMEDLTCTSRIIFENGDSCAQAEIQINPASPPASELNQGTGPSLQLPTQVPATQGEPITIPIRFMGNGNNIGSTLFSIDFDGNCLAVDPTDGDGNGVPDFITWHLPTLFKESVVIDPADTDGELDFFVIDTLPPLTTIPDGELVSVTFMATCSPGPNGILAPVRFSEYPNASFGKSDGQSISGKTSDGSVLILAPISTPTTTSTVTFTVTSTATETQFNSPTSTAIPTATPTSELMQSPPTATNTTTATQSPTLSPTPYPTPTNSVTVTYTPSATQTPTATTDMPTQEATHTSTPTETALGQLIPSVTPTATVLPTSSPTSTMPQTSTPTQTPIYTATATPTPFTLSTMITTPTNSATPTYTPIAMPTVTLSPTPTFGTSLTLEQIALSRVQPHSGRNDVPVSVNLFGESFSADVQVMLLGSGEPERTLFTYYLSEQHVMAKVPAGLSPGVYDIVIHNGAQRFTTTETYTSVDATLVNDLYADAHQLWTEPATIYANHASSLGLNVEHLGSVERLPNYTVAFYTESIDIQNKIGEDLITTGGVHGQGQAMVTWAGQASGHYTIWAVIDPDNLVAESDETNNVISRTLTIHPIVADTTPPLITAVTLNGERTGDGNIIARERSLHLNIQAHDSTHRSMQPQPNSGTGISGLYLLELHWNMGTESWTPIQESDWMPYTETIPWELHPEGGLRYIQIWASDRAGNISTAPTTIPVNYLPSTESLLIGETRIYRQFVETDQCLQVRVLPERGDPDLYIWPPNFQGTERYWYSLNQSELMDQSHIENTASGFYQIEVEGVSDTTYQMEIQVADFCLTAAGELSGSDKQVRQQPVVPLSDYPPTHLALPPLTADLLSRSEREIYLPLTIK